MTQDVAISYAWGPSPHMPWVLNGLCNRLRELGINAFCDQNSLEPGMEATAYMERMRRAQTVLLVCTPTYKIKSDERQGGVGYEGSILSNSRLGGELKDRIIPVLRDGEWATAMPAFMGSILGVDLRNGPNYDVEFLKLVNRLRGVPLATPLGVRQLALPPQPSLIAPTPVLHTGNGETLTHGLSNLIRHEGAGGPEPALGFHSPSHGVVGGERGKFEIRITNNSDRIQCIDGVHVLGIDRTSGDMVEVASKPECFSFGRRFPLRLEKGDTAALVFSAHDTFAINLMRAVFVRAFLSNGDNIDSRQFSYSSATDG